MMREFGNPNTSAANIAGVRPQDETPQTLRLEEVAAEQERMDFRRSRVEIEEEEQGNNTAKIVGGVLVGLLIVGGGIYAYETSSAVTQQQLALKTPTSNHAALDQVAQPAPPATPPAMAPDNTVAPAPASTAPSPSATRPAVRAADNTDTDVQSADNTAPSTTDQAINAPMTLTPDNAPPAQQSSQMAMQQPVTSPDVSAPVSPMPAIADNEAPAASPPAEQQTLAQTPTAQLPADQAQQSAAQ